MAESSGRKSSKHYNRKSKGISLLRRSKHKSAHKGHHHAEEVHKMDDPRFDGMKRVWVASNPSRVYEVGFLDVSKFKVQGWNSVQRGRMVVETLTGRTVSTKVVYPANEDIVDNISSLRFISEPTILHNLEKRALEDQCYTYMGPVLIAVNPLKEIPFDFHAGAVDVGTTRPHPYSLAESVISRLHFGFHSKEYQLKSQSIVISGESGAGKTVASKQVLQHVVKRCFIPEWGAETKEEPLDERMLATNPILEAFGNASTLRNPNSSRFGKFFKLEFNEEQVIHSGSLVTYLLERSRVSVHEQGERNFHIFYQLLSGASKEQRKRWHLDKNVAFRYLIPSTKDRTESPKAEDMLVFPRDKDDFERLNRALENINIEKEERETLFDLLMGLLYLGDVELMESSNNGAKAKKEDMKLPSQLLGIDPTSLTKLFCERTITVGKEVTTVPLTPIQATKARDGIVKEMYGRLFQWIELRINHSIRGHEDEDMTSSSNPFIGVLDIFGFESFEHNGLQQLLINYANEQLQASFDKHVLESEAHEYAVEGLSISHKILEKLETRSASHYSHASKKSMHTSSLRSHAARSVRIGNSVSMVQDILTMVDREAQKLKPTDENLCKDIHGTFAHSRCYKPVHASKKATSFTVIHFAGAVTYTVGNFLETNDDTLPSATTDVLGGSSNQVLGQVIRKTRSSLSSKGKSGKESKRKNNNNISKTSISKKFLHQINDLVETLDSTQCSYIRCIKPNPMMRRTDANHSHNNNNGGEGTKSWSIPWFDRRYVCSQLKSLGVTAAATTLRDGLPIKVPFDEILALFENVIRGDIEQAFLTHGEGKPHRFVQAILYAFDFPRDKYKLGYSKAFFDLSCLDQLDTILVTVESSKNRINEVTEDRFRTHLIRQRWRRAFNAVRFSNILLKTYKLQEDRRFGAMKLQATIRGFNARLRYKRLRHGAIMVQKHVRGRLGRQEALELIHERNVRFNQRILEREREREIAVAKAEKQRKEAELLQKEKEKAKEQERLQREKEEEEEEERKKKKKKNSIKKSQPDREISPKNDKGKRDSSKASEVTMSSEEEKKTQNDEEEAPKMFERVRKKSMAPVDFDTAAFIKAMDAIELNAMAKEWKVNQSYGEGNPRKEHASSDSSTSSSEYDGDDDNGSGYSAYSSLEEQVIAESGGEHGNFEELTLVACVLDVMKRRPNWNRRYLVFNSMDRTISMFTQKTAKSKRENVGKFTINPFDYVPPPQIKSSLEDKLDVSNRTGFSIFGKSAKPGEHILQIKGGKYSKDILSEDRSLYIAFDKKVHLEEWKEVIQRTVSQEFLSHKKKKKHNRQHIHRRQSDEPGPSRGSLDSDLASISTTSFGDQVTCKNKYCGVVNNTLYGNTCIECGSKLY